MLAALRQSTESRQLVDLAKRYLSGVKGTLVQGKKIKAEKAAQRAAIAQQIAAGGPVGAGSQRQQGQVPQGSARAHQTSGQTVAPYQAQQQQAMGPFAAINQAARNGGQSGQGLQVRQYVYQDGQPGVGHGPGTGNG